MHPSFIEIRGISLDSGINPVKTHTKLPDLSEEPKGIHLSFNGNLQTSNETHIYLSDISRETS